ncbi:acyl carrier protein [Corynebacterium uterequi]|uniref:Acyl carrier protein n=1 Tax=Corynebacterium uterequi TaxID=1072256 RepID=A0A0G3HK73_9CORY|nr:acyl carrier protein [Corynebacterium uterequi]AKK11552.1 acyl carrier protein [Corynebacterium uterequi]
MVFSEALADQLAEKFGHTQPADATGVALDDASAPTLARIAALVERVSGVTADSIDEDTPVDSAGLGSLERIEVAVRLEEAFGVRLDDRQVADLETFGQWAQYVDSLLP